MDAAVKHELLERLRVWRDVDEPLVQAIGDTIARCDRLDSQEAARRVVDTVIAILGREL